MLGKRNLYPDLSKKSKNRPAKIRTDIIAYCDGSNTIFDISNLLQIKLSDVLKEIKVLKKEKLIIDKFYKEDSLGKINLSFKFSKIKFYPYN